MWIALFFSFISMTQYFHINEQLTNADMTLKKKEEYCNSDVFMVNAHCLY